ncbi:hypothetical protein ACFQX6_37920 [Streptosporangium lutulentum]
MAERLSIPLRMPVSSPPWSATGPAAPHGRTHARLKRGRQPFQLRSRGVRPDPLSVQLATRDHVVAQHGKESSRSCCNAVVNARAGTTPY